VKRCVRCGVIRPLARFEPRRRTCRDCVNASNRGRRRYSPEGHRRWTYGIGEEQYEVRLASQGGRCPICEQVLTRPVVDHDHVTGEVRGLLCGPCNRGLGHLQDDPCLCERAALYLR
jgi:hypothetical protein